MNLLTQLLPGVRDLRTPLSVGIVWSVFLVLLFSVLPVQVTSVFRAAGRQLSKNLDAIPAAIQTSLLGFAVYMLGVVLYYVTQSAVRVVGMLRHWRSWLVLFVLMVAVVRPGAFFLAVPGIVATAVLFRYSRSKGVSFSSYFGPQSVLIARGRDRAVSAVLTAIDFIGSGLSSERRERAHFLREDAARRVLNSPFMRNQLVDEIKGRNLVRALSYLDVEFNRADLVVALRPHGSIAKVNGAVPSSTTTVRTEMSQAKLARGSTRTFTAHQNSKDEGLIARIDTGEIKSWDDLLTLERPYHGPAFESVLRRKLGTAIHTDAEMARRFVWRFTRVELSNALLDQRIAEARVRLKVDQPAVYDEYDRLRSEGDFRTAVAIPLGACVILFGYILTSIAPTLAGWTLGGALRSWLSSPFLGEHPALGAVVERAAQIPWISWVVGLVLLGMCFAAGRVKDAEAARLLYASIRQKVMKVESADLYQDSDVRIRVATEPIVRSGQRDGRATDS